MKGDDQVFENVKIADGALFEAIKEAFLSAEADNASSGSGEQQQREVRVRAALSDASTNVDADASDGAVQVLELV